MQFAGFDKLTYAYLSACEVNRLQKLAWWIHDHLPHAGLYFFPKLWAFNISWHERPVKTIQSYTAPKGTLTAPGMANFDGSHEAAWQGIEGAFR